MVELAENDLRNFGYQSSKGNQLKWVREGIWYKADYTGYEGLAEYMVSQLLSYSDLLPEEYIGYETEEFLYRRRSYRGCRSKDFLKEGEQLITLERLFKKRYGSSLYESIFRMAEPSDRLAFLVEQAEQMTGLKGFGRYFSKMFLIDAFFFNEDRHTHNIAVVERRGGIYDYCPFFDHGASLLSDTHLDYPIEGDIYQMIPEVRSKTIAWNFDEQLDAAEELYGTGGVFSFTKRDVEELLDKERYYPEEIRRRVRDIIFYQMGKYQYIFRSVR